MTGPHPRSWLFTPGDRPDRFATARGSGADAMIVDREDAVAAARGAAREAVLDWLRSMDRGPTVWVRINDRRSRQRDADFEALTADRRLGLAGIRASSSSELKFEENDR